MSAKQIISAKLRQNTLEELEQYRERHDLSRSDAIRDLLKEGLENNYRNSRNPEEFRVLPWVILSILLLVHADTFWFFAHVGYLPAALALAPAVANLTAKLYHYLVGDD